MNLIKVAATSQTSAVAGAIAGVVREHRRVEVQAIGPAAVNQAMKAVDLATSHIKQDGIHVCYVLEFANVMIQNKMWTAIKLVIEPQHSSDVPIESTRLNSPVSSSQVTADAAD
ncbi:MAG TPA: stage V sporulation protein S [Anaerolineales bacterium]|nr:stage V sporulation protein S [Anaerolineales bacterium]